MPPISTTFPRFVICGHLPQGALDEHDKIGKQFDKKTRTTEWDPPMADVNDGHHEAIRLIDERLTALGIDIKEIIAEQKRSPLYHCN